VDGRKQPKYADFNAVSAAYFRTMGIPVLLGRGFDRQLDPVDDRVAVVSETFAKAYFPGRNPIGGTFQTDKVPGQPQPVYRIVGVTKDSKYVDLREDFAPVVFLPVWQNETGGAAQNPRIGSLVVRSRVPLATITGEVTAAI